MKVAICCKAVPLDVEADKVEVKEGEVRTNSRDLFLNEMDEYAIEAALALKKTYDIESWAITVGPLRAQEALYVALAKGVDHAWRIDSSSERPENVGSALVGALKELKPDLILTGVQSVDWMGAEIGTYIAESLGIPHAFAVVEILDFGADGVRLRKEIGGGRKAEMVLSMPALLCIQSGIQRLQYVSAMRRKKMRDTPIQTSAGQAPSGADPFQALAQYRVVDVNPPQARGHAEMIAGERAERVAKVLEIIRKNL